MTIEQIRSHWQGFSSWYHSNFSDVSTKFYKSMLPFLDFEAESAVLEAACGTGNGLQLLLEVAPTNQIIGTDLSEAMLEYARELVGNRVVLIAANNEDLPFEEESFSHYVSNLSLHIVPNPAKMLAEAFRVLKPSGQIAVSVIGEGSSFFQLWMMASALVSRTQINPDDKTYMHLAEPAKAIQAIQSVGFTQILHFSETFHFTFKEPREAAEWICTMPSVAALETNDPEHCREVKAAMLREIETIMNESCRPIEVICEIYIARK